MRLKIYVKNFFSNRLYARKWLQMPTYRTHQADNDDDDDDQDDGEIIDF